MMLLSSSALSCAQLVLRAVIGTRELDTFLSEKDSVELELMSILKNRATNIGIEILHFGIRDIILPGDMKELLNKVTEAKKIAEHSQLNVILGNEKLSEKVVKLL